MELKDFVSEALKHIIQGVSNAQDYVKEQKINAAINQKGRTNPVEFDVAVSSNESKSNSLGGGITVASIFKAKGEKTSANSEQNMSRIKFYVDLKLPDQQ